MAQRRPGSTPALEAKQHALRQFSKGTPGWTVERMARLSRREIEQLRINALDRDAHEVVLLCDAALARPADLPEDRTVRKPTRARTR